MRCRLPAPCLSRLAEALAKQQRAMHCDSAADRSKSQPARPREPQTGRCGAPAPACQSPRACYVDALRSPRRASRSLHSARRHPGRAACAALVTCCRALLPEASRRWCWSQAATAETSDLERGRCVAANGVSSICAASTTKLSDSSLAAAAALRCPPRRLSGLAHRRPRQLVRPVSPSPCLFPSVAACPARRPSTSVRCPPAPRPALY